MRLLLSFRVTRHHALMRKLLLLPVAVSLCLLLAACGDDDSPGTESAVTGTQGASTEPGTVSATASGGSFTTAFPGATTSGTASSQRTVPQGTLQPGATTAVATSVPGSQPAATPANTASAQRTVPPGQATPARTSAPPRTSTPTAPVGTATLSITSTSGNENEVVEVILAVNTDSGPDVAGWLVDVEFDPSIAQAESCTTNDTSVCNEAFSPSAVRFVGTVNQPISELGRAKFRLIGASGASTPLRITTRQCIADPAGNITCSASDGTLRIN